MRKRLLGNRQRPTLDWSASMSPFLFVYVFTQSSYRDILLRRLKHSKVDFLYISSAAFSFRLAKSEKLFTDFQLIGLWFFRYFSLICQSCCGNPTVIKPTIWHWSDQISWSVYLDGPQNDDASSNVNRLPDSRAVKFINVELPLVAGPRVPSPETVSRYRYEIGNLICNQYFH